MTRDEKIKLIKKARSKLLSRTWTPLTLEVEGSYSWAIDCLTSGRDTDDFPDNISMSIALHNACWEMWR